MDTVKPDSVSGYHSLQQISTSFFQAVSTVAALLAVFAIFAGLSAGTFICPAMVVVDRTRKVGNALLRAGTKKTEKYRIGRIDAHQQSKKLPVTAQVQFEAKKELLPSSCCYPQSALLKLLQPDGHQFHE